MAIVKDRLKCSPMNSARVARRTHRTLWQRAAQLGRYHSSAAGRALLHRRMLRFVECIAQM